MSYVESPRGHLVVCTCRVQMLVHYLLGEAVVRLWCACTLSFCAGKGVKSGMHKIEATGDTTEMCWK